MSFRLPVVSDLRFCGSSWHGWELSVWRKEDMAAGVVQIVYRFTHFRMSLCEAKRLGRSLGGSAFVGRNQGQGPRKTLKRRKAAGEKPRIERITRMKADRGARLTTWTVLRRPCCAGAFHKAGRWLRSSAFLLVTSNQPDRQTGTAGQASSGNAACLNLRQAQCSYFARTYRAEGQVSVGEPLPANHCWPRCSIGDRRFCLRAGLRR